MKKCFALGLVLYSIASLAQWEQSANVLQNDAYHADPKGYLSQLDSSKIKSSLLIDRVPFDTLLLNVNGRELVTSIDYNDWYTMYTALKFANSDSSLLPPFKVLQLYSKSKYISEHVNVIAVFDCQFKRIIQQALENGKLVPEKNKLNDIKSDSSCYSSERALAATCFTSNFFGDVIHFVFPSSLYFSNNVSDELISIDIDGGNGRGFQNIFLDQEFTVNYEGTSSYVEMIVKMVFKSRSDGQIENRYMRTSFYRQSDVNVPVLSAGPKSSVAENSVALKVSLEQYYPYLQYYQVPYPFILDPVAVSPQYTLQVSYLMAPKNNSKMLRRPFIMVDGFDPKNQRDYRETRHDEPDKKLLPYERDHRGLFHYLNGDPSPWYSQNSDANFVADLRYYGYDIVFINFMYGDGDINTNAELLRGFIKEVLNGIGFRDNQTEEMILVGPSMGGLISRIALTTMEQHKEEHFVKSWISFDSPHKGANITMALQHAVDFGTKLNTVGKENPFDSKKEVLCSPAAKQLLGEHFLACTTTKENLVAAAPDGMYTSLQDKLNKLKYPIYSKNYALTNGGTEHLYLGGKYVLDFSLWYTWYTWMQGWGGCSSERVDCLKGSRQGGKENIMYANTVPYDNAPGGWTDALYSFNFNKSNNGFLKNEKNIPSKWSTFIPTSSAFGVIGTTLSEKRSLVSKNWKAFTNCNDHASGKIMTPFDAIKGVEGDNQQHMTITYETKKYIESYWLNVDLTRTTRPIRRNGPFITQTVSKPVAYRVVESIAFGGNHNKISFEKGADVNIVAGKNILFTDGFSTKKGAKMSARIQKTVLPNAPLAKKDEMEKTNKRGAAYLQESSFLRKQYNYSNKRELPVEVQVPLKIMAQPNPCIDKLQVSVNGMQSENALIEMLNEFGQVLLQQVILKDVYCTMDLSTLEAGVYFLKVKNDNNSAILKIIKM